MKKISLSILITLILFSCTNDKTRDAQGVLRKVLEIEELQIRKSNIEEHADFQNKKYILINKTIENHMNSGELQDSEEILFRNKDWFKKNRHPHFIDFYKFDIKKDLANIICFYRSGSIGYELKLIRVDSTWIIINKKFQSQSDSYPTSGLELFKEIEKVNTKIEKEKPKPIRKTHGTKGCGMNFQIFFDKFSSDSAFQLSRIKFPLKYLEYDMLSGDESTPPSEKYTNLEDYSYFDFSDDHKAKDKEIDAYSVKIEKQEDSLYLYKLLGIDNGIMVDFKFIKENGCWLLDSIEDYST